MCKRLLLNRSSKRCYYNTSTSSQILLTQLSMVWGHIASSTRVLYMWHRIWYVPALYFHLSIGQLSTRSLKKEGRKTLTVSRTHTYTHMQTHTHERHTAYAYTKRNSSKTNIKINTTKRNKMKTLQKLTKPYLTKQTLSLRVQLHLYEVSSSCPCGAFSLTNFWGSGFQSSQCITLPLVQLRKIRIQVSVLSVPCWKIRLSRFRVRWVGLPLDQLRKIRSHVLIWAYN